MKKIFSLFLLLSCILVSSCQKDSNDSLVGTWYETYPDSNEKMILGADGSYWWDYIDNNSGQYRKGMYIYDKDLNLLYVDVMAISGHNGAYSQTYRVETLTSTNLTLVDIGGGSISKWEKR